MSEDTEIWKDVEGYENKYQISNLGNVKSLGNNKTKIEKILKPGKAKGCYYFINLCKDSKRKMYFIHRLIALHFIPNPNNFEYIDHINRNTKDNRIENLRWVSLSTNNQNKSKRKNTSSQYIGVSWHKKNQKWHVQINIDSKSKYLGYYEEEEEAARAYDKFALEHYGNNAKTNFTY